MGLIRSMLRGSSYPTSGIATPEKWVEEYFSGGAATASGVFVDEDTALHYAPLFAGVRVIAEDLASLPLITYERLERGKRRATEHPLYRILHDRPNPFMTSVALRETLQGHAMTWGNGYAEIVRNGAGDVVELWPLRPNRVKPEITRTSAGAFTLMYRYTDEVTGLQVMLHPDQVLHISGLGGDGVRGYSLIGLARQSIGLGLATEAYGAAFFGNASRPSGVLKHPGELSDPARKRMQLDWENIHRGLDRAHRVAILEEGVEWQTIGIPPEDAQFLETRKFGVTEMARWLRLPPHKIGDLERATFTNIEHQALDYVTSALRIWLVRWEQAILTRLLTEPEREVFFSEHLVDALLRGDIKSRYEAYAIGRNWGWLSADDIAEMENRNPLPDGRGEVYLVPLNMKPAPSPEELEEAKNAPPPAPPPPPADPDEDQQEQDDDEEGEEPEPPRGLGVRGRGIEARQQIAQRYAEHIAAADRTLAESEQAKVTALVEQLLAGGGSESAFLAELTDLYEGPIRQATIDAWGPIFAEFAAAIAADAAADVGYTEPIELATWVQSYVTSHVGYRIASQLGQLAAALTGADAAAAVLDRLAAWVLDRPGRIARWQTAQLPNAVAREVWRSAGVTALKWVTFGSDDCPFCGALDGKVVGIEESFAVEGSSLGLGEQLQIARNVHHPPLHPGCDCQIVPA
ncbi:phage portal protein [Streptosporangium sp. KLBMP 9127]|nr:phage portal protein [Streptosporangium sp. KLBMP 9127]